MSTPLHHSRASHIVYASGLGQSPETSFLRHPWAAAKATVGQVSNGGRLSVYDDRVEFRAHGFNLSTAGLALPIDRIAEVSSHQRLAQAIVRIRMVDGFSADFISWHRRDIAAAVERARRR
ncbi:MAG: hypothetical protein LWW86_09810 [Micrococcales bacterium]|nr:hypothetical protein [Micrococcales bacterium]